jgi:hypothetical protein
MNRQTDKTVFSADSASVPAFAWRITNVHRGMYHLETRRDGETAWHGDCFASRAGCRKALRDLQAGTRPFHRPLSSSDRSE